MSDRLLIRVGSWRGAEYVYTCYMDGDEEVLHGLAIGYFANYVHACMRMQHGYLLGKPVWNPYDPSEWLELEHYRNLNIDETKDLVYDHPDPEALRCFKFVLRISIFPCGDIETAKSSAVTKYDSFRCIWLAVYVALALDCANNNIFNSLMWVLNPPDRPSDHPPVIEYLHDERPPLIRKLSQGPDADYL